VIWGLTRRGAPCPLLVGAVADCPIGAVEACIDAGIEGVNDDGLLAAAGRWRMNLGTSPGAALPIEGDETEWGANEEGLNGDLPAMAAPLGLGVEGCPKNLPPCPKAGRAADLGIAARDEVIPSPIAPIRSRFERRLEMDDPAFS
jgi:hypothetical protein